MLQERVQGGWEEGPEPKFLRHLVFMRGLRSWRELLAEQRALCAVLATAAGRMDRATLCLITG